MKQQYIAPRVEVIGVELNENILYSASMIIAPGDPTGGMTGD